MALFGQFGGLIGSALGSVGNIYGGGSPVGFGASFASQLIQTSQQQVPTYTPSYSYGPQLAGTEDTGMAIPVAGTEVATRARRISYLSMIVGQLKAKGISTTVGALLSLMKKWGPTVWVAFISSYVVDELAKKAAIEALTRKKRHMNVANGKALRRSIRRIRSFQRLCCHMPLVSMGPPRPRKRKIPCA